MNKHLTRYLDVDFAGGSCYPRIGCEKEKTLLKTRSRDLQYHEDDVQMVHELHGHSSHPGMDSFR